MSSFGLTRIYLRWGENSQRSRESRTSGHHGSPTPGMGRLDLAMAHFSENLRLVPRVALPPDNMLRKFVIFNVVISSQDLDFFL